MSDAVASVAYAVVLAIACRVMAMVEDWRAPAHSTEARAPRTKHTLDRGHANLVLRGQGLVLRG